MSSGSNGLRLRSHLAAGWTSVFSWGTIKPPADAHPPSSPKFMTSSRYRGMPPHWSRMRPSASAALTSVDGAEQRLRLWMSLWPRIYARPRLSDGRRGRAICPSCSSALAGRAYSAAGQVALALHTMAVLQVFQNKMLAHEEAGLDAASLRDLRSVTDLALRATKATAQAIGRSLSSLVVLERHLWLMITEM